MYQSIKIDDIEYELKPKLESLSDEQFISFVTDKQKIDFQVGDLVWYKGESLRKECGQTQFEVLEIKPHLIQGKRVAAYLQVKLRPLNYEF